MTSAWFRVTGRVQGVGFRAFVQRAATSLGLEGEVWNTREGAVEGRAQGESVEQLLAQLQNGPGYVESVVHSEVPASEFDGYRIAATR